MNQPINKEETSSRSIKRRDEFRERKGKQFDNNVKNALFDKLLHGFKNIDEAMSSMHVTVSPRVLHLPISTRAIGFITRFLVRKFSCLGINLQYHDLCCALYRIHLLMYEIKIVNARSMANFRNSPTNTFEEFNIPDDVFKVVGQLGAGFSPFINLISSIGVLHAFNTTYVPRHPVFTVIDEVRQIDPTMITYSNLRRVVVMLSQRATDQATRLWFYDHNPIPGARWSERNRRRRAEGDVAPDPDFPLLLNADEIMPPVYNLEQMRNDVDIIQTALETIGRKYPKYIHVGRIDFSRTGDYSLLVSNHPDGLKCHDLVWNNINDAWITNYSTVPALKSENMVFWSMEKLSNTEFYTGILHLLGELPKLPPPSFSARRVESSKSDATHTFADALGNLVG